MEGIEEKYLPLGTVVMLKGGSKRVMVTGFCAVEENDNRKMWDYSGCMYPEGFLSSDQICLFDHSQIEQVYHLGLVDEEEEAFKKTLKEITEAATQKKGKKSEIEE